MGWFANKPEWYDSNYANFAHSEAQSVSLFVHYVSNERDVIQNGTKGSAQENGNSLIDAVIII